MFREIILCTEFLGDDLLEGWLVEEVLVVAFEMHRAGPLLIFDGNQVFGWKLGEVIHNEVQGFDVLQGGHRKHDREWS